MSPRFQNRRVVAALAVAAVAGGAFVALAAPANAADNPLPWQATEANEHEQAGTLSLYSTTGQPVFSGSLSDPLAGYAVASGGVLSSDDTSAGANAYVATPTPGDPGDWSEWPLSLTASVATDDSVNQGYSVLPTSVRNSNHMVVPLLASSPGDDESIGHDLTNYPSTYPAPDNNVYEIRVLGAYPNWWYVADIEVDNTAGTWTQIYPTPVTGSAPDAPAAGTPTATTNSVTVKWTAPADNGSPITSYTVQYKPHTSATWITKSSTVSPSATSYTITGLAPGTAYDVHVAATNDVGMSAYSATKTITTLADATALTISKATKIAYGKTVTIGGTIKDTTTKKPLSGASVSLYSKPTGSSTYKLVKTVKSSSTGAISVAGVKPAKTTTYQWRYAGTAAHKAANSATDTVTVTRTATITASLKTINKGKTTKIFGLVSPVAGGTATIQRKSGARWLSGMHAAIKRQKLPSGRTAIGYVVVYKGTAKGKFTFRVSVPSITGYGPVISATTVTVTVK